MGKFIQLIAAAVILSAAEPSIVTLDHSTKPLTLDVVFKSSVASGDCQITAPQNLQAQPPKTVLDRTDDMRLNLTLSSALVPGTKIEVLCATVGYKEGKADKTAKNLKTSWTVPTADDYVKTIQGNITKAATAQKKQDEQDVFASGFVTTASAGSAGGADIAINPDLKVPHLKSFLQIKKTTLNGGDAKHFEAGARYQVFFLADRKAFQAIQGMGDKSLHDVIAAMNEADKHKSTYDALFIGSSLDIAGKVEGTPGGFDVTNLVGDSSFTIRSRTAGFLAHQGFFKTFITPFGFEGGQSHANQDAATTAGKPITGIKPDWIARYKTGLGFRLHYEDAANKGLLKRVELSGDGVVRDLFLDESMWDTKAKAISRTGKGVRGYGQLDLKVYLGESDKGRYGLKLTYARGSLPPVFAAVKTFQFGFLWEAKDDK